MSGLSEFPAVWISGLGYDRVDGALVHDPAAVDMHPFAPELRAILSPHTGMGADAVFCIDRVPTVALLSRVRLVGDGAAQHDQMRQFCERLWNQNLARVVLVADAEKLEAWSVDNPDTKPQSYNQTDGEIVRSVWSVAGLLGGEALNGRDAWFDPDKRVDKILLDNILVLVERLTGYGLPPAAARRLVARLIFITYLEDRGIVGQIYRGKRQVRPLYDLIKERDSVGLHKLIRCLRADFNGDFLTSADGEGGWENLTADSFAEIFEFLSKTTLRTGQKSFWRYDFSHIPIQLIASIYETFLASKDARSDQPSEKAKRRQGAYYTPRLLADWVVDLALQDREILSERIFDGACGSGMLLTSVFRRLIRAYEMQRAIAGKEAVADFATRRALLTQHIFGGDVDEDACQLTAFSLYLALLSDLSPPDLVELRNGGHKLPSLSANIRRGAKGDFFSADSQDVNNQHYTLFISNPPWRELEAAEPAAQAMQQWQLLQGKPTPHIPKRQIAAAFALGAADTLAAGGRAALILPVNLFVSGDSTQRDFRAHLLGRYQVEKIVNFSDMRRLIFADAVHPFVVFIGRNRPHDMRFGSVESECFEYWTPKTDISLAFGRLAVHGADRADLPSSALIDNAAQLAIRYWGSEADVTLLQRLRRRGRIRDLTQQGWVDAKGFHAKDEDRRRPKATWYVGVPNWMSRRRFLKATSLPRDIPFIPEGALQKFPFDQIARVPPRRLFEGPRVLWTDGAHPEDGVKAVYASEPFSHQHSLAVLSAPDTLDGRLTARFLTAYLKSPMGLWLLLLLSSSVASERPKLHVQEAMDWPFWPLDSHPTPAKARNIMKRIDSLLARVEASEALLQPHVWASIQPQVNALVYEYFQLEEADIALIEELAEVTGSALQPTSLRYNALMNPLRAAPSSETMTLYSKVLRSVLENWRDATGGKGNIHVTHWSARTVPLGAAVLSLNASPVEKIRDDSVIETLTAALGRVSDLSAETLMTIPDLALIDGHTLFLVKPMVSRFWLRRRAIEDGGRLALQLQGLASARGSA